MQLLKMSLAYKTNLETTADQFISFRFSIHTIQYQSLHW